MTDTVSVLTFEVERSETQIVVHCHGRLISSVGEMFYSAIKPLLSETPRVVLDLTGLAHMDSMGLGTLARLYVSARNARCDLVLVNLGKQVRHLLGVTHMIGVFSIVGERGIKLG